jgi:hypothetical protein
MMGHVRVLLACWLIGLASCASDGGQRGTGITLAEGNVVNAQMGDIEVSLEGTDLRTTTDAEGRFSLRGDFAGDTALHFETRSTGFSARLSVNAPAGGSLNLHDVTLDAAAGTARAAATEVVFEGSVVTLACDESRVGLVSVHRAADDTDTYVVTLDDSMLHDDHGRAIACTDLRLDDDLDVRGFFADDGTIGAADLTRH